MFGIVIENGIDQNYLSTTMRQIYEKNTYMSFLCRSLLLGDRPEGHFLWHLAGLYYYWL